MLKLCVWTCVWTCSAGLLTERRGGEVLQRHCWHYLTWVESLKAQVTLLKKGENSQNSLSDSGTEARGHWQSGPSLQKTTPPQLCWVRVTLSPLGHPSPSTLSLEPHRWMLDFIWWMRFPTVTVMYTDQEPPPPPPLSGSVWSCSG